MPGTLRAFPNADLLQGRCKFNSIIFVFHQFPPLGSPTSAEALFSASGACDWLCLTDVNQRRVQLNFARRHVHEPPHLRVYSHIRGRLSCFFSLVLSSQGCCLSLSSTPLLFRGLPACFSSPYFVLCSLFYLFIFKINPIVHYFLETE